MQSKTEDRKSTVVDAEWEVLPAEERAGGKSVEPLFKWAALIMDNLLRVPGSKTRVGLNPILDFIPVVGDVSAGVVSAWVLLSGLRRGVPKILLARMALNIGVNEVVGAIPVVGSAFAFWFRPSQRNYRLLQEHIDVPTRPRKSDWLFVSLILGVIFLIIIGGLISTFWLLHEFLKLLGIH